MTEQKQSQKERIKELTDQLEEGVQAVFDSDMYREYLICMSKFHNYSVYNSLLIFQQRPDASLVAGYKAWQTDHGRYVKKGEKGIKILAPYKYKVETEERDENGDPEQIEMTGFRIVTVFAYEQTEGKELPSIGVDELTGEVKDYRRIFNALVRISPVPIRFEDIQGGAKGYYNDTEKQIAIKTGMSELQTIKTTLHEVAHAKHHSKEALQQDQSIDRRHMETEAESISFCVGHMLGLGDFSEYSFPYLTSWASGKDIKELKDSLERIRSASDEMITDITHELEKQRKREQRNAEMER